MATFAESAFVRQDLVSAVESLAVAESAATTSGETVLAGAREEAARIVDGANRNASVSKARAVDDAAAARVEQVAAERPADQAVLAKPRPRAKPAPKPVPKPKVEKT